MAEGLTIEELRGRIDVIDDQLVRLLNVRVACAVEVGRLKQAMGLAVYQPDREAHVLAAVRKAATELAGPLTAEAVVRIFERIIGEARRAGAGSSGATGMRRVGSERKGRRHRRGGGSSDPPTGNVMVVVMKNARPRNRSTR